MPAEDLQNLHWQYRIRFEQLKDFFPKGCRQLARYIGRPHKFPDSFILAWFCLSVKKFG